MNPSPSEHEVLYPNQKKCAYCLTYLSYSIVEDEKNFFCSQCNKWTVWKHKTTLQRTKLSSNALWILLKLFIMNKSHLEAFNDLSSGLINLQISNKTIQKYFKMFSKITYHYYFMQHKNIVLEGEVEIDETHLYKVKRSKARGRPYVYDVWLIGFRQRNSNAFLIYPTDTRTGDVFLPLLQAHVKERSIIYTDCYSVYVNTRNVIPTSKLQEYGYIHKFVNHKYTFVNEKFPNIHTNTVERLWRSLKEHTRRHKVRKLYKLCIARFYFHQMLTEKEQIEYIVKSLHNEYIDYFALEL